MVRLPSRRPRPAPVIARTRSPGRRNAPARATMLSPSATPSLISTASPSTMPGVTRRSSTRPSRTTSRRAVVAVAPQRRGGRADAVAAREFDLARGEGADTGVRNVVERDSHLAGAARLVDFLRDEPHPRPRPAPPTPGRRSVAGMPTAKRASDCSGASASRSIAPSTMMRNSGSPALDADRAELGRAAADRVPTTGAFTSVREMRT